MRRKEKRLLVIIKIVFLINCPEFLQAQTKQQNTNFTCSEPSILELQEVAVRYAEVSAEKIKLWRKQASRKAYLPTFSVSVNNDITELWHWEGGSTTKTEDDLLRKGKQAIEWDVCLRWDLGDLIWNSAQTSIDVRSRLMVELRNQILEKLNKYYFARKKLQMEQEKLSTSDKHYLENQLRIQELTAHIDALTAGYFTKALDRNKKFCSNNNQDSTCGR
ncbi:MAG: hypothetical protein N2606_02545 [Candidatus Omnitrophica bacterium]|nr:hypothetical protein [Candidatus Omnitrophota bacterium]